jgi:PAS domain S-box-containing protein
MLPVRGPEGVVAFWEFFWFQDEQHDEVQAECLATSGRILGRYLERQRDRRRLQESETQYRLLFERNPSPMWVRSPDGRRMMAVNQAAQRMLEYTEEEFLRLNAQDLTLSGNLPAFRERLKRIAAGSLPEPSHWQLRASSGRTVEVEISYHSFDWKGEPAVLVMSGDVTEQMRLEKEQELMGMQLRQAQKLESIGQLAAGIAHEINTPSQYVGDNLRFVRDSFTDVMEVLDLYEKLRVLAETEPTGSDGPPELITQIRERSEAADLEYLRAEIPTALTQALEGIGQVTTIVKAMKEFSHPGKKEKALADLKQAISSVVVVSRNEWKYSADLETEFDEELPSVPCLVSEINQVVLNLIVNAAHAIQEKVKSGGKGKITVRARRNEGWAEIQIADSGNGIPEHARGRIFEPFFTTKEVGKGTGQGLALARSVIVDKHGGTLHFETETGVGTTFFIRLPLNPLEKADA